MKSLLELNASERELLAKIMDCYIKDSPYSHDTDIHRAIDLDRKLARYFSENPLRSNNNE